MKINREIKTISTLAAMMIFGSMAMAQVSGGMFKTSPAENLGPDTEIMRRDPSDIIKVGDLYYLWYTKGAFAHGYDATIWYATSSDGKTWTEKSEALARGPKDSWDEQSVFTPNILVAEGKYWLFYTAVPKPFINKKGPDITKTAIGIAVSDSPDGPWKKLKSNPILKASDDPKEFDSLRVDDACLIVREGKYWLYYKGRQWDKGYWQTQMGVAIASKPEGPYVRNPTNPIITGGHEVLAWPYGKGVAALLGGIGSDDVKKTLQYSEDGINFSAMAQLKKQWLPTGGGAYRPEAFTDSGNGEMIEWGVHIKGKKGFLPFIERFDCEWTMPSTTAPAP
jgi:beta-xylosidase